MSGKGQGGNTKKKVISKSLTRSQWAGVVFSVERVARHLKHLGCARYSKPIGAGGGAGGPVYLAAVVEYLVGEILESAGDVCQSSKDTRIIPRHMELAIRGDQELAKLFAGAAKSSGGVVRGVHPFILPKKTARKAEKASSKLDKT